MRYYKYTTEEHLRREAGKEMTVYYEVAEDDTIVRSLEVYGDGAEYSYDFDYMEDSYSGLPAAEMDLTAAAKYGQLSELSESEFAAIWRDTKVANR